MSDKNIKLQGPEIGPVSGKNPKQLLVFLHGVGANGDDLISLASEYGQKFPEAHFTSPNAPFNYDMAPPGFGYQWFSLQDRTPLKMISGAKTAAQILNRYLDEKLESLNLKDENLALIGFSQGTMMSLYAGLRRSKKIAGILGYSGAFVHSNELDAEIISKPPVCLIHGTADPVVPLSAMHAAKVHLNRLGVNSETHERPGLPHSIDMKGIETGLDFLLKNLSK